MSARPPIPRPPVAAEPRIGIVGHARAGKSMYIAVLRRAFEAAGWTVDLEQDDRRHQQQYLDELQGFVLRGRFPPKNPVRDVIDRLDLRLSRSDGRRFRLQFFDPAGEVFEGNHRPGSAGANALAAVRTQLRECSGVVVLLDPYKSPELLRQTWDNVRAGLRVKPGESARFRVAICFAKADLELWQRRYRVRSAREWVAQRPELGPLRDQVQHSGVTAEWFFVSSTGWHAGMPNVRTVVNARPVRGGQVQGGTVPADHVPDPPAVADRLDPAEPRGLRFLLGLPVFTDPFRLGLHDFRNEPLTDEVVPDDVVPLVNPQNGAVAAAPPPNAPPVLAGVHTLPGRYAPGDREMAAVVRPWNVIEPVLWLAGTGPATPAKEATPWYSNL